MAGALSVFFCRFDRLLILILVVFELEFLDLLTLTTVWVCFLLFCGYD